MRISPIAEDTYNVWKNEGERTYHQSKVLSKLGRTQPPEHYLSGCELEILWAIRNSPPCDINHIQAMTELTYSHLPSMLRSLEEKGAIQRSRDGRKYFVWITAQGKTELRQWRGIIKRLSE